MRKLIFINMIRLKTLLEQASKESIRVAGKTITGKYIANTENAADKWMYFKGDNNRYYTTLKAKQSWRDLKSSLSPSNYKLATSRIESWGKVNPTTPTAETPAEPNADIPSAVPSKGTTIYTAGKPSAQLAAQPDADQAPEAADDDNRPWNIKTGGTLNRDPERNDTYPIDLDKSPHAWEMWKIGKYDVAPGQPAPNDTTKFIDTGIMSLAYTKEIAEFEIAKKLKAAGINPSDNSIGIKVYAEKSSTGGTSTGTSLFEIRWIEYSK